MFQMKRPTPCSFDFPITDFSFVPARFIENLDVRFTYEVNREEKVIINIIKIITGTTDVARLIKAIAPGTYKEIETASQQHAQELYASHS